MTPKEIIELGQIAKARANANLLKQHPEIANAAREACAEQIAGLEKTNAEQADRINALLTEAEQANATIAEQAQRIAALEAERDTWRKQALEENAAADAATETKKTRKRGK